LQDSKRKTLKKGGMKKPRRFKIIVDSDGDVGISITLLFNAVYVVGYFKEQVIPKSEFESGAYRLSFP
jgi:hypothetical protein